MLPSGSPLACDTSPVKRLALGEPLLKYTEPQRHSPKMCVVTFTQISSSNQLELALDGSSGQVSALCKQSPPPAGAPPTIRLEPTGTYSHSPGGRH